MNSKLLTSIIMLFFPGGGLIQLIRKVTGGPAPDITHPVNIFDPTPYEEQIRRHDAGEEAKNDDVHAPATEYGPGSPTYDPTNPAVDKDND